MKRARPYARTGLNALKARVKIRGLHAIDQRTAAAQALTTWRAEIIADLGGEAGLSTAKRTLVDLAVRTRLFIDHLDGWLLEQASLVNARRRVVLPVLRDRAQFADALARYLSMLGLERKAPAPPSLAERLAQERLAQRRSSAAAPGREAPTSEPSAPPIASPAVTGEGLHVEPPDAMKTSARNETAS